MAVTGPEKPLVCIRCGVRFEHRTAPGMTPSLQKHWAATGHGPKQVQEAGTKRAKANLIRFPRK